ncbi:chemotaxis protein CheD [Thermodesulfobacteriota bacterium]
MLFQMLMPPKYFMKPGYILVPNCPTSISTVLGSCVSVCLFDGSLKAGGMNHFQFPSTKQSGKRTARYGDVSTLTLIRLMIENGSDSANIVAQVFGGAYDANFSAWNVGLENVHMARKILSDKGIPIVSQDVGGKKGRKIIFNTRTNEIEILRVAKIHKNEWFPNERECQP